MSKFNKGDNVTIKGIYEEKSNLPIEEVIINNIVENSFDKVVGKEEKSKSAWDNQIGGNYYKKGIQPMEYSMKNGLDALQHTIIKYVTRFRDKNGLQDLHKAKHCIEMLIEYEEKELAISSRFNNKKDGE